MKLSTIIKYYLLWQLAITAVSAVAQKILPLHEPYLGVGTQTYIQNQQLYSRSNFDGNHYLRIAKNGYGFAEQAFFPLYPNLMKKLIPYVKNDTLTGVLVSSAAFILAMIVFVRLVELDYSPIIAKYSLWALLLFPTSFFFGAVYTEALFILLVLCSFYFARTKQWWLAGIFGALAANTRLIGIFLLPALFLEWWQHRSARNLLPILLIPLGLISYMLCLQKATGDPVAFFNTQKYYGQFRSYHIVLLYQVFWRYFKMLATVTRTDPIFFTIITEFATGLSFMVLTIYSFFKKIRPSYIVFNLAAYLVPTFTGNFVSLPRYVLACFPGFILIGMLLAGRPLLRHVVYISFSYLFFVLVVLFSRGYWVG